MFIISLTNGLEELKSLVLNGLGSILLSIFRLILISSSVSSIGSPLKSSPTTAISISLSGEKVPFAYEPYKYICFISTFSFNNLPYSFAISSALFLLMKEAISSSPLLFRYSSL